MSIHQRGSDQSAFAISMAHALHDDLAYAALVLGPDGQITSHTPNATALLGCADSKLAGHRIGQLPATLRHLLETALSGAPTPNANSRLQVRVYPLTAPAAPSQRPDSTP